MKKFTFTILFTCLVASCLMSQPLIPTEHGLDAHQPAWNESLLQVQEYTLSNGFAWWSSYIDLSDNGLSKLETALNQDALIIKNDKFFVTFDANTDLWTGNLSVLENSKMYLVLINSESTTFSLEGTAVNTENVEIEITNGWNWLGYPSSEIVNLEDALANYNAQNNDVIKSQKKFSSYSSESQKWLGTLNTLNPGEGYILLSNGSDGSFHYSHGSKDASEDHAPSTFWQANSNAFALNMNLIASIQLNGKALDSEDFELGAFYGDECRGTTVLQYIEETNSYVAFLTISGEGGEPLQFRLLDRTTGTVYTEDNPQRITYNDNTVVGSISTPCLLSFKNILSSEETLAGMLQLYPNPLKHNGNLYISLPDQLDRNVNLKIQIVDLLGQVVKEETLSGSTCTISGDLTPGLYLVKAFSNDALILNNKLIVK